MVSFARVLEISPYPLTPKNKETGAFYAGYILVILRTLIVFTQFRTKSSKLEQMSRKLLSMQHGYNRKQERLVFLAIIFGLSDFKFSDFATQGNWTATSSCHKLPWLQLLYSGLSILSRRKRISSDRPSIVSSVLFEKLFRKPLF